MLPKANRLKFERAGTAAPKAAPVISADLVLTVPAPIAIPADAMIDYQYVILPLPLNSTAGFAQSRFVPATAQCRSSRRSLRPGAEFPWLRSVQPGVPYAPSRKDPEEVARSRDTKADILAIYTPGAPVMTCPDGMAKKYPAGSDLVLQLHYTSKKVATADQPQIGSGDERRSAEKTNPTSQMGRDDLRIPPGDANYRASVSGTPAGDALLISLFPHMHLRGAAFDFDIAAARTVMVELF